jgi:hypothetical protein
VLSTGDPYEPVHRPGPPRRGLVLAQAWWPSTRALADRTVAGGLALAVLPTIVVVARGGTSFDGALVIAALAVGALAAFSVEDAAEETLAASPTTLGRRRLVRLSALVLGGGLVAAAVLTVAAGQGGDLGHGQLGRRAAELAAVSGLAIAGAAAARRRGVPGAVHGGAAVAVLTLLLISSLAYRIQSLPALVDDPEHERWLVVAAIGWLATAWSWRDPGR